jgi:hypothetical protein
MSKVDPVQLSKLDRRSTILLQAARAHTETVEEKGAVGVEDPGMDALRGSFGTVGSIIRARSARRMSQSSQGAGFRARPPGAAAPSPYDPTSLQPWVTSSPIRGSTPLNEQLPGMKRHQLYDAPVPLSKDDASMKSPSSQFSKRPTIKFDSQDVVHSYHPTGSGDDRATHEHRIALGLSSPSADGYPPTTTPNSKSNLLEMDSPVGTGGSMRQSIPIPPHFGSEHTVRSAPPTVNPRFGRPVEVRKDSRDIFDSSPSKGVGWDEEDRRKERERGRTSKRYPKGSGDDDREESVGLWQKMGTDDEESPTALSGGIRLVEPNIGNKF